MITCIVKQCSWKTNSIDRLYDHLRRHHQQITAYTCNFKSCRRIYNVRASFFRHFKQHLNDDHDLQNINIIDETPQNEWLISNSEAQPSHSNNRESTIEVQKDSKEDTETPTKSNDEEPCIIDIEALEIQMRNLSIGFNLKWLGVNVLPRKIVFEIQHDVQQQILKPLEEVVNTMQISGLLSMEGQRIFKKMFEMFDGTETEYKFVENLKSADLYVAPREFVISNELRPGIIHNEQGMNNDPITGKYVKHNNCSMI